MKEHHQQWLALVLTVGEFCGAGMAVIHRGDFFALYLAFTYLVRETKGGREYHRLASAAVGRIIARPDSCPPVVPLPYLFCLDSNPFK